MSNRIDLDPETSRRVRVHCAQVPGRNQRDVIAEALLQYLDKVATAEERQAWGSTVRGRTLRKAALDAALKAKGAAIVREEPAFRLQELLPHLGDAGEGMSEQTLRRTIGTFLREAGYVDRRMRLRGCSPTQCWVWPGEQGAPAKRTRRAAAP